MALTKKNVEICQFAAEEADASWHLSVKNTFVQMHCVKSSGARIRSKSTPPDMRLTWAEECASETESTAGRSPRPESSDEGIQSPRTESAGSECEGVTTLMLRNIPCRCTEAEVLEAIAELGFADIAQFFYMPVKSLNGKNLGYTFIGFADPMTANVFRNAVDGLNIFKKRQTKKLVSVVPAHVQGLQETLQRFSKSTKSPVLLGHALRSILAPELNPRYQ